MTTVQTAILSLVSSFCVNAHSNFTSGNGDVGTLWIFVTSNAPDYRKCRNAIRKEYGLTPLWDKRNLQVGDKDNKVILVVTSAPYKSE